MGLDDFDHVVVTSRADWRGWLTANAETSPGIWLVLPRRGNEDPAPTYDDVVEEALCFGWIDSTVRTRDERFGLQPQPPRAAEPELPQVNLLPFGRSAPTAMGADRPNGSRSFPVRA